MARAVVFGATGHIGAHVVRALLADGHQVRATYRREQFLHVLDGLPVERVQADLNQREALRRALDGCEWVFDAAGYYPRFRERRRQAVAQAVASTRLRLDEWQRATPARIVFTSSAATIRRILGRLATEADAEPSVDVAQGGSRDGARATRVEPGPLQEWTPLYATVKIAMEREVMAAAHGGLPIVVVNPSLCIGEYDAHPFSGRLVLAFAKHRIPFYVDHQLSAIYTGDVGIGHVRAAQRGRTGERYLLTCRNLTLKEVADVIAATAGVPAPRWRVPYGAALAAAWVSELAAWATRTEPLLPRQAVHSAMAGQRLDGTKAVEELRLPQTPLEEAVRRALAWFRQHRYL